MLPSDEAVTAESRFIMARSVSVIGRAIAGTDNAEEPIKAAINRVFVIYPS